MTRSITITGIEEDVPINIRALKKLIRYYYRGPYNIKIAFDRRLKAIGDHDFDKEAKQHIIRINPEQAGIGRARLNYWNFYEMVVSTPLEHMDEYETIAWIIISILHELRHAKQYDDDPKAFNEDLCEHPKMKNVDARYRFSRLEADADGWAYMRIYRALEWYDEWSGETP